MRFLFLWIFYQLLNNSPSKCLVIKNSTICQFYNSKLAPFYSSPLIFYYRSEIQWFAQFCSDSSVESGKISSNTSSRIEQCPEEIQTINFTTTITWPTTNSSVTAISSPLCLDDKFKVIYRQCLSENDNAKWESAPQCYTTQHSINNPCSSDLTYILDRYCYTIIKNVTFPPLCPYNDTLPWSTYSTFNLVNETIWMPLQKETHSVYGYDLMRFIEPSENYKLPYRLCTDTCRILIYSGNLTEKNCQVYHNSTHIELVSCNARYSAICLYEALPVKNVSYCSTVNSNCVQSGYDTTSKCFCVGYDSNRTLVELHQPYQNLLYKKLTQNCYIGLTYQKDNISMPFSWNSRTEPLTYSNWIQTEEINYQNQYVIITSNGWNLIDDEMYSGDCVLYELIPTLTRVGLNLRFDDALQIFELTVNSHQLAFDWKGQPLVYCFTDADVKTLIYRIDLKDWTLTDSYTFKFSPLLSESGPGYYWCEAFFYPNLWMDSSQAIFYPNQTYFTEYVLRVKFSNYQRLLSPYPLTASNLEMLPNLLKNELPQNSSFYPRILKINSVDDQEMSLTFHLSSAEEQNNTKDFEDLRKALQHLKMFELIYFRGADFCLENITMNPFNQPIIWPMTERGSDTYPSNGYCVTKDSKIAKRNCTGSFIEGAYWDEMEYCIFYSSSDITKPLLNIVDDTDQDYLIQNIDDVLTYSRDYEKLFPLDILLVANFIRGVSTQRPDVQKIAEIINNLMKVPKPSLTSAQDNFKATDHILQLLDTILISSDYGEWRTSNFVIKSVNIKTDNFYGILLQDCNANLTSCTITTITGNSVTHSDITNDTYAGVYLSEALQQQIVTYSNKNSSYVPKMVITIHYGSELFVDDATLKFSRIVFGVLLPEFNLRFDGPLMIYYTMNDSSSASLDFNCSYWKFREENDSFWQVENNSDDNCPSDDQKTVVCSFSHVTNFGVTYSLDKKNVNGCSKKFISRKDANEQSPSIFGIKSLFKTCPSIQGNNIVDYHLPKNLYQNRSTVQVLLNLEQVLLSYDPKHLDTQALIEVLKHESLKVRDLNILEIFLEVITHILEDSSGKFASDILLLIDDVLLNFHQSFQLHCNNITILLISATDVANFKQFSLTKHNKISFDSEPNIYQNEKIALTVSLDLRLQQQIVKAKSRIIFIVFKDNKFFSFNSVLTQETKLVTEVLFPELNEPLQGSIILKYPDQKVSDSQFCFYWNSQASPSTQTTNRWQSKLEADNNERDIAVCKFNHVTYFALITSSQNITNELENLLNSNLTGNEKLMQVQKITNKTSSDLIAIDISLISLIVFTTLSEGTFTIMTSDIMRDLFEVPRDILRESQEKYQATDLLLFSMDEMARGDTEDKISNDRNLAVIIHDLQSSNFSGLLVYDCQDNKCKIDEIDNVTMDIPESVTAMLLFNDSLIEQLTSSNVSRVIVTIYYRNDFFNDDDAEQPNTTMIFGVLFPGLKDQLQGSISLVFTNITGNTDTNQCAYWNYNIPKHQKGFWSNDSIPFVQNQVGICEFTHVTHFAMLVLDYNDGGVDEIVLDFITDFECILSMIGIGLIILTALLFKKWRQNIGNVILLNFSIAISLKIVLLYFSVYVKTSTHSRLACIVIGASLHYSILSECAWMLTIAILQFKRFVEVLGGPLKYVLLKALICGWAFPVIPVICVLAIDRNSYQEGYGSGLCYPSYLALYLGVWLPVLVIVTINFIIFIFILYNICHRKSECIDTSNHEILFQWRLALLLFSMLGITWLLGFLGEIHGNKLFTYLFCITASLQGFVMFLFFILFNKSTRRLYSQSVKKWFINRGIFNLKRM